MGDSFSDNDSGNRHGPGGRAGASSIARSTSSRHNPPDKGDPVSVNPALMYFPLSDSSESRRSSSDDDSLST